MHLLYGNNVALTSRLSQIFNKIYINIVLKKDCEFVNISINIAYLHILNLLGAEFTGY